MKTQRHSSRSCRALTLVELLVVLVVVIILIGMIPYASPNANAKARRIICINNLKQIGSAFAEASGSAKEPNSASLNWRAENCVDARPDVASVFLAMTNRLLRSKGLVCPADDRKPATTFAELSNTKVSYFVNLDVANTTPGVLLSGDRNLTNGLATTNHVLAIPYDLRHLPGWSHTIHEMAGNVVLADGSVVQVTSAKLRKMIQAAYPAKATLYLVMPE